MIVGIPQQHTQTHTYKKREIIFHQGAPDRAVMFCEDGAVSLTHVSSVGKEVMADLASKGDIFGEHSITIGSAQRLMSARVATAQAVVTSVKTPVLMRLMKENPAVRDTVDHALKRKLQKQEAIIIDHRSNNTKRRLARALLQMAQYDTLAAAALDASRTIERIGHDDLAELIGCTRSRVNIFMREFRDAGMLDYTMRSDITVNASLIRILVDQTYKPRK
jgi:CRP-like cAMP-binding protein